MDSPKSLKALIFANGDMNDGPMVRRALAAAHEALVIAADGGTRQARYYGLQVHLLIGDLDSVSAEEVTELVGAEIERHPEEKNETDLELALLRAAQRGATWVRLFGGLGGRLDQTISNVYLLALPELRGCDVRMVAGKQEAWLFYPGETVIEGAPGDTVSLIPLAGAARGVRTEKLYYPLHDETLAFGPARGISNVMETERARVWLQEGILLVVHTLGRA